MTTSDTETDHVPSSLNLTSFCKATIFFIFFSHHVFADLSFHQSLTKDDTDRNNRFFGGVCRDDVCTENLGFLKKYLVQLTNGDTCRTECTYFPRLYRLSGYECGSCQCNAVWQCGDVKTICGNSGSEKCLCSSDTENESFCWINDNCNRETCTSSADCSEQDRCVTGSCCTDEGTGICLSPCPLSNIALEESSIFTEQGEDDNIRRPGGN